MAAIIVLVKSLGLAHFMNLDLFAIAGSAAPAVGLIYRFERFTGIMSARVCPG